MVRGQIGNLNKNIMTVTVQIKRSSLDWDLSTKVEHTFKEWKDISTFAYRLSLQTDKEIRVEINGNGHYYHPSQAENYLEINK